MNVPIQFQIIMPLFGKSQKSPAEVVKALKDAVSALEKGEKKGEKGDKKVKMESLCKIQITSP